MASGRVIGAWGDLQYSADQLDPRFSTFHSVVLVLVLVRVHENDYLLCWRSGTDWKELAALFSISLALASLPFSCSSIRFLAAESEGTRPRLPLQMSAWATQARTDSSSQPDWVATRCTLSPDSSPAQPAESSPSELLQLFLPPSSSGPTCRVSP